MEQMDLQEKVRRQYEKTGNRSAAPGEIREEMLPMPDGARLLTEICLPGGACGRGVPGDPDAQLLPFLPRRAGAGDEGIRLPRLQVRAAMVPRHGRLGRRLRAERQRARGRVGHTGLAHARSRGSKNIGYWGDPVPGADGLVHGGRGAGEGQNEWCSAFTARRALPPPTRTACSARMC